MKISSVKAVFFSPTGNTEKVVSCIAGQIAKQLGVPMETFDYTLPKNRQGKKSYGQMDLVVFGTPVYAGRIPNKMLPYVQNNFEGNGALALPIAAFGNRSFDNALIELRNELEQNGFHTIAGAGVVTSHVFSDKIAPNRPDEKDLTELRGFADAVAAKVRGLESIPAPIDVRGDDPIGPYYTPLGMDGKPAKFLKAKPKTDMDKCKGCKLCAQVCPMGSISEAAPQVVTGICIKCQACIKKCPTSAKYFDDAALLSHVAMLEKNYIRRTESEFFV
ncbi:MAG: EFR1 family ferrodoxin [Intestinimonas sp.]|jgi:NAD-dependent dihydropyrimidine dehydrogenase PreA subunit/flavodoxin|nr:EFR1 family ferrodoxin [Intestinimonas sp.]